MTILHRSETTQDQLTQEYNDANPQDKPIIQK